MIYSSESLQTELRHEWKFPLDRQDHLAFLSWLRGEGLAFRTAFPDRVVHSIYFDTPSLAAYAANLNGDSARTKVRLRWYDVDRDPETCRIEVKLKRDRGGWKLVEPLEAPLQAPLDGLPGDPGSLHARLRARCNPALYPYLDAAPRAVLWNSYRRQYLTAAEGVRLTIDTDLRATELFAGGIHRRHRVSSGVHAVVEVKCALDQADSARATLREFPGHVGKFSKYVQGLGATLP